MEAIRLVHLLKLIKDSTNIYENKLGIFQTLAYIRGLHLISEEESLYLMNFFEEVKPTPTNKFKDFVVNKREFLGCSLFIGNIFKFAIDNEKLNVLRHDYLEKVIHEVYNQTITTGRKITILKKLINGIRGGEVTEGICNGLDMLHNRNKITLLEHQAIKNYLIHYKPTVNNEYAEFIENPYWTNNLSRYWWNAINVRLQTKKIRIDYLTKLINNIK